MPSFNNKIFDLSEVARAYSILNAPLYEDLSIVKQKYKKLALKYHPDRNKSEIAKEKFQDIAGAYGYLDYFKNKIQQMKEANVEDPPRVQKRRAPFSDANTTSPRPQKKASYAVPPQNENSEEQFRKYRGPYCQQVEEPCFQQAFNQCGVRFYTVRHEDREAYFQYEKERAAREQAAKEETARQAKEAILKRQAEEDACRKAEQEAKRKQVEEAKRKKAEEDALQAKEDARKKAEAQLPPEEFASLNAKRSRQWAEEYDRKKQAEVARLKARYLERKQARADREARKQAIENARLQASIEEAIKQATLSKKILEPCFVRGFNEEVAPVRIEQETLPKQAKEPTRKEGVTGFIWKSFTNLIAVTTNFILTKISFDQAAKNDEEAVHLQVKEAPHQPFGLRIPGPNSEVVMRLKREEELLKQNEAAQRQREQEEARRLPRIIIKRSCEGAISQEQSRKKNRI